MQNLLLLRFCGMIRSSKKAPYFIATERLVYWASKQTSSASFGIEGSFSKVCGFI